MHRLFVAAVVAALALLGPSGIVARAPNTDAATNSAVFDKASAIVVLKDMPLSTYDGRIRGYEKTSPTKGKVNPMSAAYTKYKGYLKTQHSDFQKWLQKNVPSAKITSQYFVTANAVAVKLNGAAIGKLANSAYVRAVEYTTLYRPTMSESHKIIRAGGAWSAAGGRSDAGRGIKVGIIDSGIDSGHPFFDPTGFSYPANFPKCDARDSTTHTANQNCKYVTPKVIVAKVFSNKLNQSGFDANPIAGLGDHGTHVAGTVAGVTGKTAVVNGVSINDMSGVAPRAWLGNYNVFPGDVVSSRSEDILNAVEAAVNDGMDVLNLSLGGGYRGNNDLLAMGVDNAVAAGVVVAISAGNNGPGAFTIGSPGRARNVITTGASTNQHFVGQPVSWPGHAAVGAAVGDFDPLPGGTFAVFDTHGDGCASVAAGADGKIAVIDRGACIFSQKVANANAAGAVGVIVVNNVAGDPTAMARTVGFDDDIPAVMIGKNDGAALRADDPATVTAVDNFSEFITNNADILAGFSSQGPTFVNFDLKPDLTSVGVNVLSSIVRNEGDDWAFFSGTSMSSPHIAGSAAVLLDLHPGWTPAEVKSALVNTADRVVTDSATDTVIVGPLLQGAGRQDLTEASRAKVAFWPTSASFGKISGSQNASTSMNITLTNRTNSAITLDLTKFRATPTGPEQGDPRISLSPSSSIAVPANGTATLRITVTGGQNGSVIQGWIDLTGTRDYTIAYLALVP